MTRIHVNNFVTTLNGDISSGATSIVITSAAGFPAVGAGVTANVTLANGSTIEIVTCTAISGTTLTVTRGAEGTTPAAFVSGSVVSIRPTADSVDRKADGAASSTDNALARFDSTTGKVIQNSGIIVDDSNAISGLTQLDCDNVRLNGNTVSTTNTNGNLNLMPDGTGIVLCGDSTAISGGSSTIFRLQVAAGGKQCLPTFGSFINSANGTNFTFAKSRSTTIGSFVALQNGDQIAEFDSFGDDGTTFRSTGAVKFSVSGSVSTGIVPSQCIIYTTNTSGVQTAALTISNAQACNFANGITFAGGSSLNNYTDSTFTPTLNFGGATTGITYTTQSGVYSRVGNVITFTITIVLSNKGSATGTATITGLPIAPRSSGTPCFTVFCENLTFTNIPRAKLSSTTMTLQELVSGSTATNKDDTAFTNTSSLIITGSYLC